MAYCTTTSFYCSLSVSAVRFDHALQEHTQAHVVAVIIPFRHRHVDRWRLHSLIVPFPVTTFSNFERPCHSLTSKLPAMRMQSYARQHSVCLSREEGTIYQYQW
jgi:hypothetical protein